MKTCIVIVLLFGFGAVSLVMASPDTVTNEIFVKHVVNETRISTPENKLYLDLVELVRSYIPTSVFDLFYYLKNEEFLKMVNHFIWRMVSFILGYNFTNNGRSGQTAFNEPLITIPYFNYPVTLHQLEGFVMDSLAVYRKWESEEL